jgi:hypothetical protein
VLMSSLIIEVAAAPTNQATVSQAATIASRLGTSDNPIVAVVDVTPYTDPEQLLGIAGQYVSKAYFRDSTGLDGAVEVFSSAADAQYRMETQLEYRYDELDLVRGAVVVRLFYASIDQNNAYEQRLTRLFSRS